MGKKISKVNKKLEARRKDYDVMVSGRGTYIGKSGRPAFHRPGSNQ